MKKLMYILLIAIFIIIATVGCGMDNNGSISSSTDGHISSSNNQTTSPGANGNTSGDLGSTVDETIDDSITNNNGDFTSDLP